MNNPFRELFEYIFIIIFLCLLLLSMCGITPIVTKHMMDEEDFKWFNPYEIGDTIYFQNTTVDKQDTMIVEDKVKCNPATHFPIAEDGTWLSGNNELNGYGLFGLEFIHAGIKDIGYFIAKKYSNNEPAYLSFSILDNSEAKEQPLRTLTSIEITGHMLNDCIVIDKHSIKAEEHTKTKLNYIVWSKSLGLVEYVTTDGEQYILSTLL